MKLNALFETFALFETQQHLFEPTNKAVKRTDIVSPTKSMDPTLSSKTSAQLVCQGSVMTLSCRSKWLALSIQSAFYGREYPGLIICPRPPTSDSAEFSCFVKDAYPIVKRICDGKANCSISANKSTFKDPCPNVYKYLSVTYKCGRLLNIEI